VAARVNPLAADFFAPFPLPSPAEILPIRIETPFEPDLFVP
jgi:hypothetical protein